MHNIKKRKTLDFIFSDKHKNYIRNCRGNTYNIAEGAVRAGKTVDNVFAFANDIMRSSQRIHLATGSTVGNAKLNIGDCNGFGLESIFRGQCNWSKYKNNEALIIKGASTGFKEKIVVFAGGAKADSYKRIRGNTYEKVISTEVNLHHKDSIKEMIARTLVSKERRFFWDLNPDHPKHWIYEDYIDRFLDLQKRGEFPSGINYEHFTIRDNNTLTPERVLEIESEYDSNSIWYKRDILGLRVIAEGLIYRSFADSPDDFTVSECNNLMSINIGVDFGGDKSKHAFVASGITKGFRNLVVLDSVRVEPGSPEDLNRDFIDFVRKILNCYGFISSIKADNVESVLIRGMNNALAREGFRLVVELARKSSVIGRIRAVNSLIAQGRFFVVKGSDSLVEALCMASWDPKRLEDSRLDDFSSDIDTLDAFEYSFEDFIGRLLPTSDGLGNEIKLRNIFG
ncbi:PBSX family phage terminase large subunit [Miniphocaeibacter massiliensis]|uniref:PBSX family phage terminase large subunit n=1 Tax=Miniphocaeibacter massiliensis TaxID=2041841 RepID=UPI000C1B8315|nr:PBSX family phage terminase large subunit [Miniphocaeibacter massiliensis]